MELSILLAQQIASMLLMILMGYAAVKGGIFKADSSKVLSAMVLYLLAPCMIFSALQIEFTKEHLLGLLIGMGISVCAFFLFILVMRISGRVFRISDVERAAAIYSNCGNLLIPIAGAVLGPEYVFVPVSGLTLLKLFSDIVSPPCMNCCSGESLPLDQGVSCLSTAIGSGGGFIHFPYSKAS